MFFKTKAHYLGFLIGVDGVQPLPEKVATIQALESPRDINKQRQDLGFVKFYRKFITFFSDITICLNKMLRKGATFKWTEQSENAFQLHKAEFAKMPALQYPNPNKPFKYFTDASKHSYSRILHQEKGVQADTNEPEIIPVAYFSGTFNKTQQLWITTQKESYAGYRSAQKFTFYLTGTDCTLYCEHKPLIPFFTTGM